MKGRRQARRAALQALYELDQSTHAQAVVLAGREDALYEMGMASALPVSARGLSLQVLVAWRLGTLDTAAQDALARRLGTTPGQVAAMVPVLEGLASQAAYMRELVTGVRRHQEALDRTIHRIAPEWPVVQMAPVDRNILRIALWEIGTGASPTRVAINEAVELARTFGGDGARRMVNGALGAFVAGGAALVLARDETPALPS